MDEISNAILFYFNPILPTRSERSVSNSHLKIRDVSPERPRGRKGIIIAMRQKSTDGARVK
jgi:hypothetical protein